MPGFTEPACIMEKRISGEDRRAAKHGVDRGKDACMGVENTLVFSIAVFPAQNGEVMNKYVFLTVKLSINIIP